MTVNLYTTSDDTRRVTKSLTSIATGIDCKPAEPCPILTPRIILNNSPGYLNANYMYIPDFHRFYFCDVTPMTGRELLFTGSVDVLHSFDLQDIDIMCTRSESAGVNYCPDKQLPIDPDQNYIEGILFPAQPFTERSGEPWATNDYLLIINGN